MSSRKSRGQILSSTESVLTDRVVAGYAGLGSLRSSNLRQYLTEVTTGLPALYATNDTTVADALGNLARTCSGTRSARPTEGR